VLEPSYVLLQSEDLAVETAMKVKKVAASLWRWMSDLFEQQSETSVPMSRMLWTA
jgi:hypothetical protein